MDYRAVWRLGAVALCLLLPKSAMALDARVEGLEGAAAGNIVNYLQGVEAQQYTRTRLEGEVRRRTQEALRAFGYYEPQIHLAFDGEPPRRVTIMLEPGPQVVITVLDVEVAGEAEQDPPFQALLDAFPLSEGDPLRHAPYDSLRNRLSALSLERGYFDSRFSDRRMEVRPWEESARLYLTLDSGPRYRFGEVTFRGSQIDEDRLRRMLPFNPGDPYLAGELALYNQRLGQSNWFSSITVRPRLDGDDVLAMTAEPGGWWQQTELVGLEQQTPALPGPRLSPAALAAVQSLQPRNREVPVDVTVTPADRHQFEVAVGYATDVGPRTSLSWNRPWLNSAGHSLSHELFLSGPEQQLTGQYVMPLDNPLRDSYRMQYGFRHRDHEDTRSLEASLEVARRWEFDNGWVQSAFVRTTYEDYTQAGIDDAVYLLYPGINWSRTRTRNPRFPTWGDRQGLTLEYSDSAWGSGADFLRITADSQWIRMLGENNRFVGRVGVGAMETDDFESIPPSLRFFAGGDRSVRGYAFENLGPRDEQGRLLGGQHVLTASLEVQRRITGDWWGAAFIDTGNAFNEWWPEELNTGAGLGVRWISPVGPIRFDIAHPFDDEEDSWRIHFAIGPEF
ncbi:MULTISPECIES: autotransporter assembly complex family protein [Halomonadaceae]|uniref:autotransporter assembly complex protein TamA n=1 Tax=Halomonadaceae TaxID=28256 RepID=UPI0015999029|nr:MULTISPECIES: autotransporter assembly complex family protein [Halomonas]QJQ96651.1 outer membrane protein assembly factor [Halomonas sp. PA5]